MKILQPRAAALRFAAIITITSLFACSEITESRYASYESLASTGAFGPYKIFADIPVEVSARDIHYAFDIDTNEVWVSFLASRTENFPAIARACVPTAHKKMRLPVGKGPGWWPTSLHLHEAYAARTDGRSWRYFTCKRRGWVAVDTAAGAVFFYREGS